MRVRLDLMYVGTRYVGWQRQSNGLSVQEVVEKALSKLYAKPITIAGAGRTDAGVHAQGQVAHFDTPKDRPAIRELSRILNKLLPSDIAVRSAVAVPPAFHARKSAVRRTYLYRILMTPNPDPFRAPYVWHVPWSNVLDLRKISQAAGAWIGRKDFASFTIRAAKKHQTRRHMEAIVIRRVGDELRMTFMADAFLHRMIRRMVAVLVDIGAGKNVSKPAYAAPACGLCLMKVDYR